MLKGPEPVCNTRENKHIEIDNSIAHMDETVERLRDLKDRIKGVGINAVAQPDAPRDVPSLEQVLDSAPGLIISKSDEMRNLIDDISHLLF